MTARCPLTLLTHQTHCKRRTVIGYALTSPKRLATRMPMDIRKNKPPAGQTPIRTHQASSLAI